ncbi:hypothetical protein BDV97DRAFT_116163 [Delphinella strobiligena]|nr:hypothetical protein BDV97DRAFT_116163 [Delphinella strobiligena]
MLEQYITRSVPDCYFSIPSSLPTDETPSSTALSTPSEDIATNHPLGSPKFYTYQPSPRKYIMDVSRFLQVQTQAAHIPRPQPQPLQNVLHVDDESLSSPGSESSSPSNSNSLPVSAAPARCSRCQRTLSVDMSAGKVSYGLNLWYCSRCAGMVGYNQ